MERSYSSRRPELLLLVFVLGYLVLLTVQIRHQDRSLFGNAAMVLFRPLLTLYNGVQQTTHEGIQAYLWQKDLAFRCEQLERRNHTLEGQLALYRDALHQNIRLRELLSVAPPPGMRLVGGRALMQYGAPFGRFLLVSVASGRNIPSDSIVIDNRGLVGRVQGKDGDFLRVLLVTDPSSAVGVRSERTGVLGVAAGGGGDQVNVKYIGNLADVQDGDVFVTSGDDGIYPPGLTVGRVSSVTDGPNHLKEIRLKPAVVPEKLSWVLLAVKDKHA